MVETESLPARGGARGIGALKQACFDRLLHSKNKSKSSSKESKRPN